MLTTVLIAALPPVVVLAALAASAPRFDRWIARRAQCAASEYLSAPLGHPATVRVRGRPFLPQAVRGCYRDVEVVGALRVGVIEQASLVAHLTNVLLPTRHLLRGGATEVACEHVQGRVLLPYVELARAVPIPDLTLHFEGERLLAAATLPVPGMGRLARINGEAELTRADTGTVRLRVRGVSVAGVALPGLALGQVLPALNVAIRLPALPYGLHIDELRPTAGGLVVDASAHATVFRAAPVPDETADGWPATRPD